MTMNKLISFFYEWDNLWKHHKILKIPSTKTKEMLKSNVKICCSEKFLCPPRSAMQMLKNNYVSNIVYRFITRSATHYPWKRDCPDRMEILQMYKALLFAVKGSWHQKLSRAICHTYYAIGEKSIQAWLRNAEIHQQKISQLINEETWETVVSSRVLQMHQLGHCRRAQFVWAPNNN